MVSLLFTLQYYIANEHHPVSLNIDSDVVPECINSSCDINEIKQIIHLAHYSHKILTHI